MNKAQAVLEFVLTYGWAMMVLVIAILAFFYFTSEEPTTINQAPIIEEINCTRTTINAELYMFNQTLTIGRYRIPDAEWKNIECTTTETQLICDI